MNTLLNSVIETPQKNNIFDAKSMLYIIAFIIGLIVIVFLLQVLFIIINSSDDIGQRRHHLGGMTMASIVMLIGTIVVALPFVYEWNNHSFYELIKESSATFLTFTSIVLLYVTLKQQIKFNKVQIEINERGDKKALAINELNSILTMQTQITNLIHQCSYRDEEGNLHTSLDSMRYCCHNNVGSQSLSYSLLPLSSLIVTYFATIGNSSISDEEKLFHYYFAVTYSLGIVDYFDKQVELFPEDKFTNTIIDHKESLNASLELALPLLRKDL